MTMTGAGRGNRSIDTAYPIRTSESPLIGTALLGAFLAALFSIPSLGMYLGNATSQSAGLVAVVAVSLFVMVLTRRLPRTLALSGLLLLGIMAHAMIAFLLTPPDIGRAAASFVFAGAALILCAFLANWMFSLPGKAISGSLTMIRWLMVSVAIVSIAGIQPKTSGIWDKPIFPFTEPSHFALVFTSLLLHACVVNKGIYRYIWLAIGLGLTVALQSLSLAVSVAIAGVLTLSLAELALLFLIILGIIGAIDISYFADRLDFNSQSKNISTLVYMEGTELASDALRRTGGWGLGFQQLGQGPFVSPSADVIFKLTNGRDLNVEDGGFVAAKIVAEFGIFGIAVLALMLRRIAASALRLRAIARSAGDMELAGDTLALALVVGSAVELFVRGIGYFSSTVVLALTAWMYLRKDQRKARSTRRATLTGE